MEHIIDRLTADIQKKNSVVCIGLDPASEAPENIFDFNKQIIDATHDLVVAFKPQIAYYEQHGPIGLTAFKQTIDYIHSKGLVVIDDAKRGDIGSTGQAYARGHFDGFGADCLTLNLYGGSDSATPFLEYVPRGKGVFIWLRSSNPSARELQDLEMADGQPLYAAAAQLIKQWGQPYIGASGYSAVGAVVGATFPEESAKLRSLLPQTFWLVPGYGAQGGNAQSVKTCFDADGLGAIISASRSIIYAENPRAAAMEMRDELNKVRNSTGNVQTG